MANNIIEEIRRNLEVENREIINERILKGETKREMKISSILNQEQENFEAIKEKNLKKQLERKTIEARRISERIERNIVAEDYKKAGISLAVYGGIALLQKGVIERRESLKEKLKETKTKLDYEERSVKTEIEESKYKRFGEVFRNLLQNLNISELYPHLLQTLRTNRWLAVYEFPKFFIEELKKELGNSLVENTLISLTSLTRKISIPGYGFELKETQAGLPIKIKVPHYAETFNFR